MCPGPAQVIEASDDEALVMSLVENIARHTPRTLALLESIRSFVKRQKNDSADAEAICEAALRPTMRFVAVKSAAKQASANAFKVRDLLVRQKTQVINALRGHL